MSNGGRTDDDTRRKRGVAILDTETGKLVDVNNGYAAIFGQEQDELIGTKPEYIAEVESKLVIPVYEAMHGRTRGLYELLEDEDNGEYVFYRDIEQPDPGNSLFVQFTVEQLAFNGDQFVLITAVAPETDAPYYNMLERFRYRLDAMMFDNRLGWWEFDVETGDAIFHENKVEMLGVSPGDVQTVEDYIQILSDDSREIVLDAIEQLSSGEAETIEITYPVELRDGDTKWVREIGAVTQYTQDMEPMTVTGLSIDITAEKEAEESTRELIGQVSILTQLLTYDVRNDIALAVDQLEEADIGDDPLLNRAFSATRHALRSIDDVQGVLERMSDGEIEELPTEPISLATSLNREIERLDHLEGTEFGDISIDGLSNDLFVEASPILCSVFHNVFMDAASLSTAPDISIEITADEDVTEVAFKYPVCQDPDEDGQFITYPAEDEASHGPFGLYLSREIIEGYGGGVWMETDESYNHLTIELPTVPPELSN